MRNFAALAVVGACVAMLAAGCGSSDSSSGASTGSSTVKAAPASGGSLQDTAKKKMAEFETAPTDFPGPTAAISPGSGKAEAVACGFAAPVCAAQAKFAVQAIKAMGWSSGPALDGAFSPQKQASFVDQAVQRKLNGLIMVSVDLNSLKASVDRAVKAGLFIACTMCANDYSQHPEWKGHVFDVTIDWKHQGEINAWAALARNGTKTKVVSFQDKAYPSTLLRAEGYQTTMKANCPSCSFEIRDFATANIAKPGPPEFTALLSTKPAGTITDAVAHYDGLGVAMAKTAKQQGRTDITISGYDASSDGVGALAKGDPPYGTTVGEAYTYSEWAAADLLARSSLKKPVWTGYDALPVVLVDKTNAQKYLNSDPVPAGDWQGQFKKMWNKG